MALDIKIKKHLPTFDLDIEFTAGAEAIGFLGASGCGKSLTLRCIAGVETPDEGHIIVNGKTFFELDKPDYILKPGIKKKTFKLKAKKVVNLVAGDISILDMN